MSIVDFQKFYVEKYIIIITFFFVIMMPSAQKRMSRWLRVKFS